MECNDCVFIEFFSRRLSKQSKLVLLAIADGATFPHEIAQSAGIAPQSVARSATILLELGLIDIIFKDRVPGVISFRGHRYVVCDEPIVKKAVEKIKIIMNGG